VSDNTFTYTLTPEELLEALDLPRVADELAEMAG